MIRFSPTRGTDACLVGLLLLAGLLLTALPAGAQTITVTSAVPDTTEQGTVDLVVTIGGEGFAKGAKAAFYVTGTTNPGGITVKSTKYKNAKTLEATIDVALDAQTELKFDVQVTSGTRTGKGTELFKVLVKQTGGDPIPPGTVVDLQATAITFNTATFTWTAAADDGYDPGSGPAVRYDLHVRKGYDAATPQCGPFTVDLDPATGDPCGAAGRAQMTPGMPGATETLTLHYMAPGTQYWAMVRTLDDAPPTGQWSVMADDVAHQISFTTSPFPPTRWIAESPDPCQPTDACAGAFGGYPQVDFDPAGNPVLLYAKDGLGRLATWTGGGWLVESAGVPIGSENGTFDLGFDPASGQAAVASPVPKGSKIFLTYFRRTGATSDPWAAETVLAGNAEGSVLRFNPSTSRATIAYFLVKGLRATMRLAERVGSSWTNQDVASDVWRTPFDLAFDRGGNPAVTFIQGESDAPALRFALRQGATWSLETVDAGPGAPFTKLHHNALAFDPLRGDFAAAAVFKDPADISYARLRYCERSAGVWSCTTLDESDYHLNLGASLAFTPDGTGFLAYTTLDTTLFVAVRPPGGAWTREEADWNVGVSRPDLALGHDGQPGVAYVGNLSALTSLPSRPDPVRFARRTPTP
jgi:hypothetical protein